MEGDAGQAIWSRPTDTLGGVRSRWSPQRHTLLLEHGYMATELLDWNTGERLAWFEALSRAVTPIRAEIYANDLQTKWAVSATYWETRPLPPPDQEPAEQSLARTLQQTSLVFHGVELVAAP